MAFLRKFVNTTTKKNNQTVSANSNTTDTKKQDATVTPATKLSEVKISPQQVQAIEKHSEAITKVITTKVEEAIEKTRELVEIDNATSALSTKIMESFEVLKVVDKILKATKDNRSSLVPSLNKAAEHIVKLGFTLENDSKVLMNIQQNFSAYTSSPPATETLAVQIENVRNFILTVANNFIETYKLYQAQKELIISLKSAIDQNNKSVQIKQSAINS